jgi:hypothetical protein
VAGTFNFAELKARVRRVTQDTLGVPALYSSDVSMSAAVDITARLRARMDDIGDLSDQGYATIIQSIDRIVLIPSDYPDVEFKSGGYILFIDSNLKYQLDTMEMENGPLTQLWRVSKVKS